MKKILISVLLASLTFAAFADDAKVLPSGVMRATFANILINTDSEYDSDGEKQDSSSEMMFDNFGAALEFGVTDTISAAVQWAPGTMLYGKMTNDTLGPGISLLTSGVITTASDEDVVFKGLADLFVGAKIQLYNDNNIRFALAPGLKIPLDSYDPITEGKAIADDSDFRVASQSDTESLGFGGRIYFDYQITDDLYINFYNQTIFYLSNERYDSADAITYAATYKATGGNETAAEAAISKSEYEYPIYFDFEVEPHYDLTLSKTGSMGFGLPVKYSMNGETTVDGVGDDKDSYIFSINPGLSFFYTGGIPFEVAANYNLPLMGKNTSAQNIFTFKLKLFYDFY